MSSQPVVEIQAVSFAHGGRRIFQSLDLEIGKVNQGSVTAIVGASGVGKSTFLRLIAGLEQPATGRIAVAARKSGNGISFLSQEPVIFDHLCARENALYLEIGRGLQNHERFKYLAAALRLESVLALGGPVTRLSGGERQRLAIMRSMLIEPDLLLLDEPCAGLDPTLRGGVIDGLQRAIGSSNTTVLYVTHHLDEIALASDRVMFFERPKHTEDAVNVICLSTPEFLIAPPTLDAARFALFPRCNLLHGCFKDNCFEVANTGIQYKASIAFAPGAIKLNADEKSTSTAFKLHSRGAHLWTEIGGESITVVAKKSGDNVIRSALMLQPGVFVYDALGRYSHTLTGPLNLISV
jgi:ABC-type nitrate/sulfonate/bicarbonate transport system ATPase subunit